MQNNQKLIELLEKYKSGTISAEEKALLDDWYNQVASAKSAPAADNDDVQASLRRIRNRLPVERDPVRIWPKLAAAATLLILAGGLLYFYTLLHPQVTRPVALHTPGQLTNNKVILQLASGKKIELNSQQEGITIKGKQVIYNNGNIITAAGTAQVQNMTLSTPKGSQYRITLPDGTQVWLNATTRLTYPDRFEGDNRIVQLDGEAYFEVSPDVHPFIVKSRGQEVVVLGTSFNIMAYENEPYIETALVSGAVKVNATVLKPGFKTQLSPDGTQVLTADLKAITAWKDGMFYFRNANLTTIMRQLQRWYDIDVEYKTMRTEDEFTGQIPRNKPLEKVLEILQLSGVNCKVEGRKLIVN
jgi:ferric-dicitrate binding protein FerR (iron transport regulator)